MNQEQFLNEAERIGQQLLEIAERDEQGMSWRTLVVGAQGQVTWEKKVEIYDGVSGISLFLGELYQQTKKQQYLDGAVAGMQWAVNFCRNNPSNNYAFYTGRMGVVYSLVRFAKLASEPAYLEMALQLARPCLDFLEMPNVLCEMISGVAGTVVGLLHLHAATAEEWILEAINHFVAYLLQEARPGPQGLCWDASPASVWPLCGFSHGTSGIAFAFTELGRYFQNETFFWLAEQAFLYEDNFYDPVCHNWLDLRKELIRSSDATTLRKQISTETIAFLKKDTTFFSAGKDMNAWCHGAAGIGLSRLHFYTLTSKEAYRHHVEMAIEKTIATDVHEEGRLSSYTLCHGRGGNTELFLEAYRLWGDERYLLLAEKVAFNALTQRAERGTYLSGMAKWIYSGEDTSLFIGDAGIGYFFLRLLAPHDVPSILLPTLNVSAQGAVDLPTLSLSLPAAARRLVLHKRFPRTLTLTAEIASEEVTAYLATTNAVSPTSFAPFITRIGLELTDPIRDRLADILELEQTRAKVMNGTAGHYYLQVKAGVRAAQAAVLLGLDEETLLATPLQMDPESRLITTAWDWSLDLPAAWVENLQRERQTVPILLVPEDLDVREIALSTLAYSILMTFIDVQTPNEAIAKLLSSIGEMSPTSAITIRETIIAQIRHLIVACFLVSTQKV